MMRTVWAVLLTMFLMHAVTVYFLVFHKDRFCQYSSKSFDAVSKLVRRDLAVPTQYVAVKTPKEFSDAFGSITGVEASDAFDESYTSL